MKFIEFVLKTSGRITPDCYECFADTIIDCIKLEIRCISETDLHFNCRKKHWI